MANKSLADLDNNPGDQQQQQNTNIQNGDGTQTLSDLEAAKAAQTTADVKKPLVDQPPGAKVGDKPADTPDKPAADADGTNDDDEPEGSIWEEVDKLRGEVLPIEWKDEQGEIPEEEWDTPRGIIARERAIEFRAVERFEEDIQKNDPRGYQYLLHRKAGGTDEEFFAQKTITLPDYDRFKESVDLQTKVYGDSLRNAGLPEKQIKQLVDNAVKDKELFELADAAYNKQKKDEETAIVNLNKKLENEQVEYQRSVRGLQKALVEQVSSTEMNIIVPEAKRTEFLQYLYQHVEHDGANGFLFVQRIDPKLLPRMLEAMYLQFSGGKLDGLVQRQAQTLNTKRLKRTIDKSKQLPNSQADTSKSKKTLSEL